MTDGVQEYCTKHFNVNFNLPLSIDAEIGTKMGDLQGLNMTEKQFNKVMKEHCKCKLVKGKNGKKYWAKAMRS